MHDKTGLTPPRITTANFFFNAMATTQLYTLSLHDALPILVPPVAPADLQPAIGVRPDVLQEHYVDEEEHEGGSQQNIRSEEHTSELQSQSNLVCRLLLEKKKQ